MLELYLERQSSLWMTSHVKQQQSAIVLRMLFERVAGNNTNASKVAEDILMVGHAVAQSNHTCVLKPSCAQELIQPGSSAIEHRGRGRTGASVGDGDLGLVVHLAVCLIVAFRVWVQNMYVLRASSSRSFDRVELVCLTAEIAIKLAKHPPETRLLQTAEL